MSKVLIQMSMSLDGYVAGPNDDVLRLHEWMFAGPGRPPGEELPTTDQQIFDELRAVTGAMICGRRLYDLTHGWNGSTPFGAVPVFVVSRSVPAAIPSGTTSFTFVTGGILAAVAQAKDAAGGKDVYVVGGASIDQQLLEAALVDELRIDLVPVLRPRHPAVRPGATVASGPRADQRDTVPAGDSSSVPDHAVNVGTSDSS